MTLKTFGLKLTHSIKGLFYCPSNSLNEYWSYFDETNELATDQNTDMIMFGDFNQDILQADKNNKEIRILTKYY